jgi:hypothetical protein
MKDQSVADEIEPIIDRVESDETISDDDIPTLITALGGPLEAHIPAIEGLLSLTNQRRQILEEEYPEIVESLLSSRQSIAIARELLHRTTSLRTREVPIKKVLSGTQMAGEKLVDYIDDIAEKTAGTDEVVPGGGAAELDLAFRLENYANSISGREQLAFEEISEALKTIPRYYAKQTGVDPIDVSVDLRSRTEPGQAITLGVSNSGRIVEMDGENERVSAEQVFRHCYNGIRAVDLIVYFERTPSQLLRSEAVLTEELR